MRYKEDWAAAQGRILKWWAGESIGRPLMWVTVKREPGMDPAPVERAKDEPDIDFQVRRHRQYVQRHKFIDASIPQMSVDLGPGSMALYLGCEPVFMEDTIWYESCVEDWRAFLPLKYDEDNRWWALHQQMARRAKELADGDFLINMPDIMENLDVLSSLRGAQQLCYDLLDEQEPIHEIQDQMDGLFYRYVDAMYDILKGEDGSSSYTAFRIWGPGKTMKVQCDFSSLMSPGQYREFALPCLARECRTFDNTLYHLDGTDAVKHLDAILEVRELSAVQWEPGDYNPDCGDSAWYPIYDKVRAAGKGLWLAFRDGGVQNWIHNAQKIVDRYGSRGLYFIFPTMSEADADTLLDRAEGWHG